MISFKNALLQLLPWRARQSLMLADPLLHPDLARLSQRELADLVIPPEEPSERMDGHKTDPYGINEA